MLLLVFGVRSMSFFVRVALMNFFDSAAQCSFQGRKGSSGTVN